jgi:TetR/AcrR family transcriptional repressor of nem operon
MSGGHGSREKILYCARELFYFVGYQTTSVDDILRACGVAKSNFYYHFRTKDELALAVLDLEIAEFEGGALKTLSDTEQDPMERLSRFCEVLLKAQAEVQQMGGCPFGNFAAALSSRDGDNRTQRFRDVLGPLFSQIQSALAACLRDGVYSGAFRHDVPTEELAMTILAAIEGLMLMTKTQRDAAPLRQGLLVLQYMVRVH